MGGGVLPPAGDGISRAQRPRPIDHPCNPYDVKTTDIPRSVQQVQQMGKGFFRKSYTYDDFKSDYNHPKPFFSAYLLKDRIFPVHGKKIPFIGVWIMLKKKYEEDDHRWGNLVSKFLYEIKKGIESKNKNKTDAESAKYGLGKYLYEYTLDDIEPFSKEAQEQYLKQNIDTEAEPSYATLGFLEAGAGARSLGAGAQGEDYTPAQLSLLGYDKVMSGSGRK